MRAELLMIRKRWDHMGLQSGSDLLCEQLANSMSTQSLIINQTNIPQKGIGQRMMERFKIMPKENLWSNQLCSINGIKEIYVFEKAVNLLNKYPDLRLFVSCAEEQLTRRVNNLKPLIKKRIYVLLHQPVVWIENEGDFIRHLNGLGGVFVFSKQMKSYLDQLIDAPIVSIMHGVDMDFFNPGTSQITRNSKSIICVGNWFRDFELLSNCWSHLHQFDQDLKLTLISSSEALKDIWFQKLIQQPNVVHKTGLESIQLLEAYQTSCLHLLPLLDGVANNALVESLATGCPVLTTNTGSVNEYLPQDHFGLAKKGDVEDHYLKTISLLSNSDMRNDIALKQRQFAMNHLSWQNIGQQVMSALA
ncbi:MAG: glycosyltransferase [Bacteroidota bacterium]